MPLTNRICVRCGVSFVGPYNALYCQGCRHDAILQRNRECAYRKRRGLSRKIGVDYPCQICGRPYTLEIGNQKFCPACSAIHRLDVAAIIQRNRRAADIPKSRSASKVTYDVYKSKRRAVKSTAILTADLSRIRDLRLCTGLSCYALASKAHIGHSTLGCYEAEVASDPYVHKLERVAFALGMTNRDFWRYIYHDMDDPHSRGIDASHPLSLCADLSRLEILRSHKGLTPHGLSTICGLHRNAIVKLETSAQTDVRLNTLELIAKAFDMRPIDLLLFLYD